MQSSFCDGEQEYAVSPNKDEQNEILCLPKFLLPVEEK